MPPAAAKVMRYAQPQYYWQFLRFPSPLPPSHSLPSSPSSFPLFKLMNTQFMPSLSLHCIAISHSAKLKANLLPVCRKFSSPPPCFKLFTLFSAFLCHCCCWRMTLLTFPFEPSANITHTPRCLRIRFWIFEMCINFVTGSTKSYICQKAGKE